MVWRRSYILGAVEGEEGSLKGSDWKWISIFAVLMSGPEAPSAVWGGTPPPWGA